MELTCTQCHTLKPLEEFHPSKKSGTGRYSYCKACGHAAVRERRAALKALGPILGPTRRNFPIRARTAPLIYADPAWLTTRYIDARRPIQSLADEAGVSITTITRHLKEHQIPIRTKVEAAGVRSTSTSASGSHRKDSCPDCGAPKYAVSKRCSPCGLSARRSKQPYNWSGSDASYRVAHQRLNKARGSATKHQCRHCDAPAKEWAYDHEDPNEKYDDALGHFSPYSVKFEHYFPLCGKCHRDFDREQIRRMIREGGSDVVQSANPPDEVTFSFHWLAQTARNNKDLWVGVDGSLTIRQKATYQVLGISSDFKGLMCRRIDARPNQLRAA